MSYPNGDTVDGSEYCWDEFKDWAEDTSISLEHKDDWEPWWLCWISAIAAKGDYIKCKPTKS